MMNSRILLVALILSTACNESMTQESTRVPGSSFGLEPVRLDTSRLPRRIAFGSCAHHGRPQPILRHVVARRPDLFVWLGDNVYGDTRDMNVLRGKYAQLAAKDEFRALRKACANLAIWDDHDYGENDAGRHYPMKERSKEIFCDFWGVPLDSPRRTHPGIHHAHLFEEKGRRLQVILLDTRTFRDDLLRVGKGEKGPWKNDYRPQDDGGVTLLGSEQWAWLEKTLRVPADLRVIATSIQFGHSYNGWESWTNLPRERERMIGMIRRTRADGVIFISGDVHWGEISRQDVEEGYPLYDVTASGINQDWPTTEPNHRRLGPVVTEYNFGMIEVDWKREDPRIDLLSIDVAGKVRNRVSLDLSTLRWAER